MTRYSSWYQPYSFIQAPVWDWHSFPSTGYNRIFAGRRSCVGEALARAELFMFIVATVQRYIITLGQTDRPTEEGHQHFTLSPPDYKITLQLREQ